MKRALKQIENNCYWIDDDGTQHKGVHDRITGDVSGIWGDVTGIWGDVTDIRGYVTGITGDVTDITGDMTSIWGNVTGIWGDVTGITGYVDKCDLSDEERKNGINISDLVAD